MAPAIEAVARPDRLVRRSAFRTDHFTPFFSARHTHAPQEAAAQTRKTVHRISNFHSGESDAGLMVRRYRKCFAPTEKLFADEGDNGQQQSSPHRDAALHRDGRLKRHLAYAGADHRFRLPDLADVLRPALLARFFPHPDVGRQSLGPRRLRLCAGAAKPAVGHRPAARRHHRRPLRRRPGVLRRRADVCRRPRADVACDQRSDARYFCRRADRVRPFRHLVHGRSGGVRQSCCRRSGARSLSALAPRRARSGNSSIRRSPSCSWISSAGNRR